MSELDLHGKLGEYTLLDRIGRGGMSSVYHARSATGKDVAVKVLKIDPSEEDNEVFLARFDQEARIVVDLHHPNILPIYEYGQDKIYLFIVTRLLGGGTLADVIKQGQVEPEAVSHWVTQIAAALDHAHSLEVIHRDLKPTNVLLDKNGDAFLTDFGIARITSTIMNVTETGSVVGTPAYMAPEQWRAEVLDARTDIYGLGVIAFLMLTQRTPFEADTPHRMMYHHLHDPVPSLKQYIENISPLIDRVVLKALAKNPKDRYASAGAFAEDLANAVQGQPIKADLIPDTSASFMPHTASEFPPPINRPYYGTRPMPALKHRRSTSWGVIFGFLGALLLALGIGAFALLLALGVIGEDNQGTSQSPTPTIETTPNNRPVDVPRIRIDSPANDTQVMLNQPVEIRYTAFYRDGVTRIEMRRFGAVIQEMTVPDSVDNTAYTGVFYYMPDAVGPHRLEIIAFQGDLEGDPRFVTLQVGEGN